MTASLRTSLERTLRRAALLLVPVAVGAALVLGASPALAHDGLVGTSPAAAATVATAPATVELEFTGEPLPLGTLVAVTGPDGAAVSDGPAEIEGTRVVQRLTSDLPAGAYRVDWRSTSSDGHALSGTFDFTVTAGSAPSAATTVAPSPASEARPAPAPDDGGIAPDWLVGGAVVLVGLAVVLGARLRRRA
jgi:copper resistance protein C